MMADTSLLAWKGVKARGLTKRETEVLAAIEDAICRNQVFYGLPGATLFEVCLGMQVDPNQISGRFSGLKDQGKIRDSGLRRENHRGESCTVWVKT